MVKMMITTNTRLPTMRDSFDRFGDKLAKQLLSSMKMTIEDKLKQQLVSKQWMRLIFSTQTNIGLDIDYEDYYNYSQSVELFSAIVQKCPNIHKVVISSCKVIFVDNKLVDIVETYCRHLRHISLIGYTVSKASFDRLLAEFGSQLQTLVLLESIVNYREVVTKISQHLPQLKKLVIGSNYFNRLIDLDYYFTDGSGVCILPTTLLSVAFSLSDVGQSLFGQFVGNYANQLTALDIVVKFEDESVVPVFVRSLSQLYQLRQLRLMIDGFSTEFVCNLLNHRFSRRCYKIKYLFISINFEITVSLFKQLMEILGKDLKQLKRLAIDCWLIYEPNDNYLLGSNSLKHMKQLTQLSLRLGNSVCSDEFFRNIGRHLPQLRVVNIINAVVTLESLKSLSRLLHLTTVRLVNCHNYPIDDHLIIGCLILAQPMVTNVYISYANYVRKFTLSKTTSTIL